jgi:predicted aldo/keto reductase-like oxidoreductase
MIREEQRKKGTLMREPFSEAELAAMNPGGMTSDDRRGGVSRRDFVKLAIAGGVAVAAGPPAWAAEAQGGMIYRTLGRTGEKVSAIGLGGYHAGLQRDEQESIKLIRTAIDGGITFMDNCWDYNGGRSEERMGKALQDGYRKKVFLMTKTDGRTKAVAAKQIDESLKRLQTDVIDLIQFHEIVSMESPDRIFSEGAIDAVLEAKKAGKVRYIGFTGHKDPDIHLHMLDVAAKNKFRFDAVQMPLNVMDAHFRSFEKKVVPVLVKDEIGVLGMKSMGFGAIARSRLVTPAECLQYALNLPTSTVILGMDNLQHVNAALEVARNFKPMDKDAVAALLAKTAETGATGQFESFKTGSGFDMTPRNPSWTG